MQTVHVSAYMIRTVRGNYVRSDNDDGLGYALFRTKSQAKEWIIERNLADCYVVKIRAALTPTYTAATKRVVAVHATRPTTVPKEIHHNFFP